MARDEATIKKLFQQWDEDGSGTIDRNELSNVMKKLCGLADADIDVLIDEADRNKDGVIDYHEFLDWLLKPATASTGSALLEYSSILKPMFDCYDRDGSGEISLDEFIECHCIMQGSLALFPGDEEETEQIKLFQMDADHSEAFQKVDKSQDGLVSFTEFVNWQKNLFEQSALSDKEVSSFIKQMTQMLEGIFDVQSQVEAGYDVSEEALQDYIQGLAKGMREYCAKTRDDKKASTGGSTWTEPPVGLNVETLKRTFTKVYPMKMRNVKHIELTVMCVPMPDVDKDPDSRGWVGEVVRRVEFQPDMEGNAKTVTHKPAYFEYDRESFSWKALKAGEDQGDFASALQALALEMRLFCLLKTEANFGIELRWRDIMHALEGAVDMEQLSAANMKVYRGHMIAEAMEKGRQEGFDASEAYALSALDNHLRLRPRQVMATLTELGIVQISDVWQDFVQSD
eukprot:TRINITY_DN112076_c0_g1_i1.p1 TRINITY_DN112076_c0_g1~~TRINITY_DN112076_c0_g1_i1.p1  ORF type:complete len:456 (-),score=126.18 TRINITY_DN112076_c0_g1_i1:134-1501(-)